MINSSFSPLSRVEEFYTQCDGWWNPDGSGHPPLKKKKRGKKRKGRRKLIFHNGSFSCASSLLAGIQAHFPTHNFIRRRFFMFHSLFTFHNALSSSLITFHYRWELSSCYSTVPSLPSSRNNLINEARKVQNGKWLKIISYPQPRIYRIFHSLAFEFICRSPLIDIREW